MMILLIILSLAIVLIDTMRLSLMEWKENLLWIGIWMVAAYFSTLWLTGLSLQDIYKYSNFTAICILGFVEILIFMSYLLYDGKGKALFAFYPGLMMLFPVTVLAYAMSRIVSVVSFMAIGLMSAVLTGVFLTSAILFLRWLKCDRLWLYISSVACLVIYILIYGIS